MGSKRKEDAARKPTQPSKRSRASSSRNAIATSTVKTTGLESHSQIILQAAQKERKMRQLKFRQVIQQLREQPPAANENRDEPLQVFPEEIWVMILEYIDETETLINCSEASLVFRRLINPEKIVLFGKALPFLSVHFSKSDILSCRQVCSHWRSGVESLLESYHDIPTNATEIPAVVPPLPLPRPRKFNFETILAFTEEHNPRIIANLLPGGSVTIDDLFEFDAGKLLAFENWLDNNGERVRHATVDMKRKVTKQLSHLCSRLSKKCLHLKSLTFSGGFLDGAKPKSLPQISYSMPSLESLKVTTKCPVLQNVQHNLIRSLSDQLKSLTVCHWNAAQYEKLSWMSLQELKIIEGNSSQMLQSLAILPAPQLQKLKIRLDSTSQDLAQLFKTLNHLPKLQSLGLTLTEQCPTWSAKEIMQTPVNLLTSNKITSLEVVTEKMTARRDFLICFPLLRNLILRCGKTCARGGAFQDKSLMEDSDDYEDFSQNESSEDEATRKRNMERSGYGPRYGRWCGPVGSRQALPPLKPTPPNLPDFLDLNKFTRSENLKDVYQSNIWKVMPLLGHLQLQHVLCQPKGYRGQRPPKRFTKIYNMTKTAYEWEMEEREQRQERHVEKVWQEAKQQIREMIKHLRVQTIAKMEKRKRKQEPEKILQDQALPLVLQKLAKPSFLPCRLVCKTWKSVVDKHFLYDELRCHDMVYKVTLEDNRSPINWRYVDRKRSESGSSSESDEDSINASQLKYNPTSAQLKEAIEKPFFGCFTEITVNQTSYMLIQDLAEFLRKLGKNTEHVRISGADEMDVDDFYEICVQILQHCPNLRSVNFHFSSLRCCNVAMGDRVFRALRTLEPHPNLESITLVGPGPGKWGLTPLDLMKPCENWLAWLVNFPRLKHFKMAAGISDAWMKSLETYLEAPNLEILELRLDGGWNTIEQLITVVNKFPKVKKMGLEFYEKFGGLSNLGVIYTNTTCLATNITTVNITVGKKEEVSLDFLVHFPCLRKLCITYGDGATKWTTQKSTDEGSEADDEEVYFREPERDYVQLVQYLGNKKPVMHDTAKILKSNIWTVLKRLEKLEVVCCLTEMHKQSMVFTRIQRESKIESK